MYVQTLSQGYLAHKKTTTPLDHRRALDIGQRYRGTSLIRCGDSENACFFLTQTSNFPKNACLFLEELRNFSKNACLFLTQLKKKSKNACLFLKNSKILLEERLFFKDTCTAVP